MPTWNIPIIVNTSGYSNPVVNGLLGMLTINLSGSGYSGSVQYLKAQQLAWQSFPLSPITLSNGTLTMVTPGAAGGNGVSDPNWNRSQPQYTFTAPWDGQSAITGGSAWLPINLIAAMRSLQNGVQGLDFSVHNVWTFGTGVLSFSAQIGCDYSAPQAAYELLPNGVGWVKIYLSNSPLQATALILQLKGTDANSSVTVLAGPLEGTLQELGTLAPGTQSFAPLSLLIPVATISASGSYIVKIQNNSTSTVYLNRVTFAY